MDIDPLTRPGLVCTVGALNWGGHVEPDAREESVSTADDGYEPPKLTEYGTIESWTRGARDVTISIII